MDSVETQKRLGEVWRKLSNFTPIEFLPIEDVEFLSRYYGDDWKAIVKARLQELENFHDG